MDDVTLLEQRDLRWSFSNEDPHYSLPSPDGGYASQQLVDPVPCYPHDVALVRSLLGQVKAACPLDPSPHVYVLSHEPRARTNGWAEPKTRSVWNDATEEWDRQPGSGHIVLAGKRIPPHPAVTRYLVAHEYGHHVDYALCRARGVEEGNGLDEEYAKARGCEQLLGLSYGPGTWHKTVGELIANDFRILIANVEAGFWPHDEPHPFACAPIARWWRERVEELRPATKMIPIDHQYAEGHPVPITVTAAAPADSDPETTAGGW